MNAPTVRRYLLSGMLLACSFPLSGCFLDRWIYSENFLDQRPALIIIVKADDVTNEAVSYTLDLKEVEISGVRPADWLGKAQGWRINLFRGGNRVAGHDEFITDKASTKLEGVPVDKLLRADLDLFVSGTLGQDDAKFKTESFTVLFHPYPDWK